jgi:hypothetical protein
MGEHGIVPAIRCRYVAGIHRPRVRCDEHLLQTLDVGDDLLNIHV